MPPSALSRILHSLTHFAIPFIAVYVLSRFVDVTAWAFVILQAVCLPIYLAARVQFRELQERRAAARRGAILPPPLEGKSFGSIDLLIKFMKVFKEGYLCDNFDEAHAKVGPTFELKMLWDTNIMTIDANIIKIILATDFNNYVKGDFFQSYMYSVLGTGVFNADGEMWKFHRSMTRPFFSRDRVSHFDIFEKHADEALLKMKNRLAKGYAVDFQDLISRFTLDSASEFLFGKCVNVLSSDLPYPNQDRDAAQQKGGGLNLGDQFAHAFSRAQVSAASRARLGHVWPWLEVFADKTKEDMRIVDSFLNPILEGALEKWRKEKGADSWSSKDNEIADGDTFLDHLVRTTTDPKVIHDEILNILIAGRDTTAGTLTFAIYFLCMYPRVLERLRKEVLETVGYSRRPDYDDIKAMKYLRAFLNEVLRLYPAVPLNVRYAIKDTTLPNPDPNGAPFFVPAGRGIGYSVMLMHRRKDYWGEDADEFDPDRFLDDRVQHLLKNPFIFLPFNAGPRICLGQQFAYNEMSFFLVKLLQNVSDMSLQLDCQDPKTLPPKDWANFPGRKGVEKVLPKSHLTAYVEVSVVVFHSKLVVELRCCRVACKLQVQVRVYSGAGQIIIDNLSIKSPQRMCDCSDTWTDWCAYTSQ
ncbi:cytochrom P450 [Cristinia sonorae]|uniref:Cytochrom P450 n=1 Tax=Cristinia sonorae TaxID=1940300 RepID=A0A8K0XTY7_9AGAR|nr:cytochrom P450 [Cristinia sonorae]